MCPIKNGLQEGQDLSLLLFNFPLEYDISKVKANHKLLKLNGTHQVIIYADYVNVWGQSIHINSFISSLQGEWSRNKR
jgi:hypothetical protein